MTDEWRFRGAQGGASVAFQHPALSTHKVRLKRGADRLLCASHIEYRLPGGPLHLLPRERVAHFTAFDSGFNTTPACVSVKAGLSHISG